MNLVTVIFAKNGRDDQFITIDLAGKGMFDAFAVDYVQDLSVGNHAMAEAIGILRRRITPGDESGWVPAMIEKEGAQAAFEVTVKDPDGDHEEVVISAVDDEDAGFNARWLKAATIGGGPAADASRFSAHMALMRKIGVRSCRRSTPTLEEAVEMIRNLLSEDAITHRGAAESMLAAWNKSLG